MRMAARRTVSWSTWPGIRSGPPEQRTAEASIGFYTHRFAQSKEYRPLSRSKRRRSNLPRLVAAGRRGEVCAPRWRNVDLVTGPLSVDREAGANQSWPALQVALQFHDLHHAHATHLLANGGPPQGGGRAAWTQQGRYQAASVQPRCPGN